MKAQRLSTTHSADQRTRKTKKHVLGGTSLTLDPLPGFHVNVTRRCWGGTGPVSQAGLGRPHGSSAPSAAVASELLLGRFGSFEVAPEGFCWVSLVVGIDWFPLLPVRFKPICQSHLYRSKRRPRLTTFQPQNLSAPKGACLMIWRIQA